MADADEQHGTMLPEQAEEQARAGSRDVLGRWLPGVSGNRRGRPRAGAQPLGGDPTRIDIRDASRLILLDPDYRQALYKRLVAGTAPHIESKLWDYAFGKPKETVEFQGEAVQPPVQIVILGGDGGDPLARRRVSEAQALPPSALPERPETAPPGPAGPEGEVEFTMEEPAAGDSHPRW